MRIGNTPFHTIDAVLSPRYLNFDAFAPEVISSVQHIVTAQLAQHIRSKRLRCTAVSSYHAPLVGRLDDMVMTHVWAIAVDLEKPKNVACGFYAALVVPGTGCIGLIPHEYIPFGDPSLRKIRTNIDEHEYGLDGDIILDLSMVGKFDYLWATSGKRQFKFLGGYELIHGIGQWDEPQANNIVF